MSAISKRHKFQNESPFALMLASVAPISCSVSFCKGPVSGFVTDTFSHIALICQCVVQSSQECNTEVDESN